MAEQIRVLQVLGRLDRGGAETMIMNLYRHMDRSRVQFDFVIHTKDVCDYTEEVGRLGGRIFSMERFRASTALSYRRQWRRFFREHPCYRIVHGHMRSTASLYLAEAKKAGLVTIVHSHNTSSGKGISAAVKNLLQYPLRFQADYLFACSRPAGIWLYGKKACAGNRFHVLLNGIETESFRYDEGLRKRKRQELFAEMLSKKSETLPLWERKGEKEEPLLLLHVGRLEEQKNHRFLIRIMKALVQRRGNVLLLCCGTGPLLETLRREVRQEGLEAHIYFSGGREDVPELCQAADAMVFPSKFEGLPLTLVEAQAAGLPILMSDRITKEVALTDLVAAMSLQDSPKSWAGKLLEWTETHREGREGYARQVARSGYDVRENARWLMRVYMELFRNGKSGSLDGDG